MIVDVIIPALNEEQSISKVLGDLPRNLVRRVIVCDNGSTDNTSLEASKAGAIVVSQPKRGYGAACLQGIDYIKQSNELQPDIIVFIDGDYSDYPEELPNLVAPIADNQADMVIGSRVTGKAQRGSLMPQQRFGNWLATSLMAVFFGKRFSDLGPFRAIAYPALLALEMQDRNYGWTIEMQIKAVKSGLRCTEVPVSYRPRIGKSKVSGTLTGSIKAGYKILLTIFRYI